MGPNSHKCKIYCTGKNSTSVVWGDMAVSERIVCNPPFTFEAAFFCYEPTVIKKLTLVYRNK